MYLQRSSRSPRTPHGVLTVDLLRTAAQTVMQMAIQHGPSGLQVVRLVSHGSAPSRSYGCLPEVDVMYSAATHLLGALASSGMVAR